MILLLKMAPRPSAEVLSDVPQCKAILCLIAKIRVLEKLQSGMSYGAVGREFDVNALTIHVK